jgi:ribosomal protein S15P/S13E
LFENTEEKLRGLEDIEDRRRELVDHLKITERKAKYIVQEQKERKR